VKRALSHTNSFAGERLPKFGVDTPKEEELGHVSQKYDIIKLQYYDIIVYVAHTIIDRIRVVAWRDVRTGTKTKWLTTMVVKLFTIKVIINIILNVSHNFIQKILF